MVPEPNHGAVSLWKTSPHGERICLFFFFFFRKGPWLEAFSFCAFFANLSGFQLLIRCVFIGMKAAPDYESGWDVVSGELGSAWVWIFFF